MASLGAPQLLPTGCRKLGCLAAWSFSQRGLDVTEKADSIVDRLLKFFRRLALVKGDAAGPSVFAEILPQRPFEDFADERRSGIQLSRPISFNLKDATSRWIAGGQFCRSAQALRLPAPIARSPPVVRFAKSIQRPAKDCTLSPAGSSLRRALPSR